MSRSGAKASFAERLSREKVLAESLYHFFLQVQRQDILLEPGHYRPREVNGDRELRGRIQNLLFVGSCLCREFRGCVFRVRGERLTVQGK